MTKSKPALKLKTKPDTAPLKVTSSTKVDSLNADLVDGKDAAALGTAAYTFTLPVGGTPATTQGANFPGLPVGSYLVSYDIYGNGASDLSCYLRTNTLSPAVPRIALSRGDDVVSASGVVVVPAAPALPDFLRCESTTAFTFGADGLSFSQIPTVTFLRLDQNTVAVSK